MTERTTQQQQQLCPVASLVSIKRRNHQAERWEQFRQWLSHVTSFFFLEILASSIRSSTAVPVRFFPQNFAMYYKSTPSYFMIFQSAHSNAKFSLFLHQYKAASRQNFSWIGLILLDWKSMDCNSTRPTLPQQLFFDLISARPCCPIQFPCIYCHHVERIGYNDSTIYSKS